MRRAHKAGPRPARLADLGVQEGPDRRDDFRAVRLQGEVAGVVEAHLGRGDVAFQASAPAGRKYGSFLPQTASSGGCLSRK